MLPARALKAEMDRSEEGSNNLVRTRAHPGGERGRPVHVTDVFRNQEGQARERHAVGATGSLWQVSTCPWSLSSSVAPHEAGADSYGSQIPPDVREE